MLANKSVVLGVSGGIAAFKVAELASQLTKAGALVDVIMTRSAMEFVQPLTFQTLTQRPVSFDMFHLLSETTIAHISLAARADVLVIAPATANVIAKIAHGLADDLLTTTVLSTQAPILIVPAMEENMLINRVTRENLARLRERGMVLLESPYGRLASGKMGKGRMAEVDDILVAIRKIIARQGDLVGRRVIVTAGGTQEPIDPVRFIGNRSSGKMGFALAEAARDRGAEVTLILGPTQLPSPKGVAVVDVETALEMKAAVEQVVVGADVLIMAAAVADFRVEGVADQKIKREKMAAMDIHLVKNPDILAQLSGEGLIKVGFAAESENLVENARGKLERKKLQLIVANDVTSQDSGFGVDTNRVTLISADGAVTQLPLLSKRAVADEVLNYVARLLRPSSPA